jgi:protein-L-isoaspartate(D-aspartate) O-methyltransferase
VSASARAPETAAARRAYAEELCGSAGVTSTALLEAFAAVPREWFVGPGPWQILGGGWGGYHPTPDADPAQLYRDVLVALDIDKKLNTGRPSLWAGLFERLGVAPGERVMQVGAGTGYFTAILAELVGTQGRVAGYEVETNLARRATIALAPWPQAVIVAGNALDAPATTWDVIVAFAGAPIPPAKWVDELADRGRLMLPLTNDRRLGIMLLVRRAGAAFGATTVERIGFYPCAGTRDAADVERLTEALATRDADTIRSLRRDRHDPDESCWLHGDEVCLSSRTLH